jgi:hypothetical protein
MAGERHGMCGSSLTVLMNRLSVRVIEHIRVLGRNAVVSCRSWQTFRRNILAPSSEQIEYFGSSEILVRFCHAARCFVPLDKTPMLLDCEDSVECGRWHWVYYEGQSIWDATFLELQNHIFCIRQIPEKVLDIDYDSVRREVLYRMIKKSLYTSWLR